MSGKNPSRSCEDVDEAALSYAEVKALASGDPRIIEMTDLDSQVTKLKLLKANHEGQRYQLEDQLIQFFPKAINRTQEQITGLEQDLAVVQAHPLSDKEHFSITVAGQTYTERKAAGQAIIDACHAVNPMIDSINAYVIFGAAPFNLIKGLILSVFTLLLYKKMAGFIRSRVA